MAVLTCRIFFQFLLLTRRLRFSEVPEQIALHLKWLGFDIVSHELFSNM